MQQRLPAMAVGYVVVLEAVTIATLVFLWAGVRGAAMGAIIIGACAVPALVAARLYALPVSRTTHINLFDAVAFALLLIVGAPIAAYAGAASMAISSVLFRRLRHGRDQGAFNTASHTLAIAAAGSVYTRLAGGEPLLGTRNSGLGVLIAALLFVALSVGMLGVMIGLARQRQETLGGWLRSFGRIAPQYACLLSLGLILAVTCVRAPFALPAVLIAMGLLHQTLKHTLKEHDETNNAMQRLACDLYTRSLVELRATAQILLSDVAQCARLLANLAGESKEAFDRRDLDRLTTCSERRTAVLSRQRDCVVQLRQVEREIEERTQPAADCLRQRARLTARQQEREADQLRTIGQLLAEAQTALLQLDQEQEARWHDEVTALNRQVAVLRRRFASTITA